MHGPMVSRMRAVGYDEMSSRAGCHRSREFKESRCYTHSEEYKVTNLVMVHGRVIERIGLVSRSPVVGPTGHGNSANASTLWSHTMLVAKGKSDITAKVVETTYSTGPVLITPRRSRELS